MRRLPLFPLPVVLFPGTLLPLHIFEPRYRQLVAHCLKADRRFGLLYHDPDRSGPFDMEPGRIGCVAEILQFDPIPDGRSLVLVRGEHRFRLEDGIESGSLYYEGLVDTYEDLPEDTAELAQRVRRSVSLFRRVAERVAGPPPAPPDPAGPASFQLAQRLRIDASWQQQLLEIRTEGGRLDLIDMLLHATLDAAG